MFSYFFKTICCIMALLITCFVGFAQKSNYQLFDNVQPIATSLRAYLKKGFTVSLNKSMQKKL